MVSDKPAIKSSSSIQCGAEAPTGKATALRAVFFPPDKQGGCTYMSYVISIILSLSARPLL
jgi:hypothetical protein